MNWDVALKAWLDAVEEATSSYAEIFEATAHRKTVEIPSVEYTVTSNPEDENTESLFLQVDIFTRGLTDAVAIERLIRTAAHHDTPRVLGGVPMWSRYLGDARTIPYPAKEDVVHRALGFQLEFARQEA